MNLLKLKLFFFALIISVASLSARAQNFPAVIFQAEDGKYQPLKIDRLKVDIQVVGRLATTTMEMRFVNELNRVLEGELTFPLREGQTVSRFAMSIEDQLREGVIVEKDRGRVIFEDIVRQTIDPGLLEWTKGNNFRSRVYPIPARGTKTIVIAYEHELPGLNKGLLYSLPLDFPQPVDLSLTVDVTGHTEKPNLTIDELTTIRFAEDELTFTQTEDGGGFRAKTELAGFQQSAPLAFFLPPRKTPQTVLVEDGYLYIDLQEAAKHDIEKTLPKTLGILWDCSGSAKNRNLEKEIAVLDGYLQKIKNLEVVLVPFSNATRSSQTFTIENGDTQALLDALDDLIYDGGTQLGALELLSYAQCDEFILVSDGLSNFGETEIDMTALDVPIQVVNSAASADPSYLSFVAQSSGGRYIDLQAASTKDAIASLGEVIYQYLGADYSEGEVSEVYPQIPTPLKNGEFTLAGKLLKNDGQAEIVVKFGVGKQVLSERKIQLPSKPNSATGLLSRIWAQKKIAALDRQYEKHEPILTELGKEFGIVTRNTSLIVLDRIEDYVQHRIEPPQELLAEYLQRLANTEVELAKSKQQQIDKVLAMFTARQAWWNKDFVFDPKKLAKKTKSAPAAMELESSANSGSSNIVRSAPVPSAAAVDAFASDAFGYGDELSSTVSKPKAKNRGGSVASITLKKWTPDAPYLKKLEAAESLAAQEKIYREQKKSYQNSSAFFLDVADFFFDQKEPEVALRVLSNIAEMKLDNHQLLRILGYRLLQIKEVGLAVSIFEEVLDLRPEEPQSYRDLGLAYAQAGQYQQAINSLYEVVIGKWDGRFQEIELIALGELNGLLAQFGGNDQIDIGHIDKRLIKNLPVDVRVVLTWDADATDMDLWVIDPYGVKCYYQNRDTEIGSHISPDYTGGYGPEEMLLKKAPSGTYKVKVNYYGNRQQTLSGSTTIQVAMTTNFGRPNEKTISRTMRLKDVEEVIDVGEFKFETKK